MALTPPQGSFNIPTTAFPKTSAESASTSAFDWDSPAGATLSQLLGQIGGFNIPTGMDPTSTSTSTSTGDTTSTGVQQATSAQQAQSNQQAASQQQAQSQQQAISNQQAQSQQQAASNQQAQSQQQAISDQQAQSQQQATGQSLASSQNLSQGGINWQNPLMQALLPSLMSSGTGLQGVADNMGQTLQDQYSALMRQSLGPQAFQGTLNQLAGRNMLNSSVAGNALAQTALPISQMIGNQAFQSQLAGQQAKMQVPTTLSDLARLGQETSGTGTSQSTSQQQSTGGSTSKGSSLSTGGSTSTGSSESTGGSTSTGSSTSSGGSTSTGSSESTGGSTSMGTSQSTGNQGSTSTQKAASESMNTNPLAAYQTMASFYPSILQALGGVGRESDATSTSKSTNELSPYELMAQMMIANQMA